MAGVDKLCTFFNKPWLKFTGRSWSRNGKWLGEGVPDDLQNASSLRRHSMRAKRL
jgi:hypothetical protein